MAQKGHVHYPIQYFPLPISTFLITSFQFDYFSFPILNFLITNFQFGYFSFPILSFLANFQFGYFSFLLLTGLLTGILQCGFSYLVNYHRRQLYMHVPVCSDPHLTRSLLFHPILFCKIWVKISHFHSKF